MNTNAFSIQSAPLVINGQTLTGGLNANFTLPNEQSVINQSLDFVSNANSIDQNFLASTINSSQNMFQAQTQPLTNNLMQMLGGGTINSSDVQSSASSQSSNLQSPPNLIDLFNNQIGIMGQNQSMLAQNALQQIAIDTANTNATNAQASSGGGGCFITTAICEAENLPDDCEDLILLRKFRDGYLSSTKKGRLLIAEYYLSSPKIVADIKSRKDSEAIFKSLRKKYLSSILLDIKYGIYHRVISRYMAMFFFAKKISESK